MDGRLTLAGPNTAPTPSAESPSTVAFPIEQTNPNDYPIFARCYMGDYNAIATNGTTRFVSWGDNRNIVQTSARLENEPDVFLASY